MNKKQFISYIKNLLLKIDETNKYHDNVVAMAIDTAMEQVFHDMFLEDPKHLDAYIKKYANLTTTEETDESSRYLNFSDAAQPINLPRKSKGVTKILSQDTATLKFAPISWAEVAQKGDDIAYVTDYIWFIVEPTRLVFPSIASTYDSDNFTLYMIPRFYDLVSTDEFNMPYGQDQQVIEYVINALRLIQPRDLVTDNADTR